MYVWIYVNVAQRPNTALVSGSLSLSLSLYHTHTHTLSLSLSLSLSLALSHFFFCRFGPLEPLENKSAAARGGAGRPTTYGNERYLTTVN
jgi:hypothetical protein